MKNDLEGGQDLINKDLDHQVMLDSRVSVKSRYQTFEDYFWLYSHKEFEEQTKLAAPCFQTQGQEPNSVFKVIRMVLFAANCFEMWLTFYNLSKPSDIVRICIYFTTWGQVFTFIAICLGTYLTFFPSKTENKYSPFCAWKWYIFFFELAFSMEVIISCFFWLILYDEMSKIPHYANS